MIPSFSSHHLSPYVIRFLLIVSFSLQPLLLSVSFFHHTFLSFSFVCFSCSLTHPILFLFFFLHAPSSSGPYPFSCYPHSHLPHPPFSFICSGFSSGLAFHFVLLSFSPPVMFHFLFRFRRDDSPHPVFHLARPPLQSLCLLMHFASLYAAFIHPPSSIRVDVSSELLVLLDLVRFPF